MKKRGNGRVSRPGVVLGAAADPLAPILEQASALLLKHPVAAQALFNAFVSEGRRFALTDSGKQWTARLAGSELVRRGRVVWEDSMLNVLEDTPDTLIPTAILDAVALAARRSDPHPLLQSLFQNWPDDDEDTDSAPPRLRIRRA